jgi:hypothetical protein
MKPETLNGFSQFQRTQSINQQFFPPYLECQWKLQAYEAHGPIKKLPKWFFFT